MVCPKCGGTMKVVAFLTDHADMDRIIEHLKLRFIAEKPPPSPPNKGRISGGGAFRPVASGNFLPDRTV